MQEQDINIYHMFHPLINQIRYDVYDDIPPVPVVAKSEDNNI